MLIKSYLREIAFAETSRCKIQRRLNAQGFQTQPNRLNHDF